MFFKVLCLYDLWGGYSIIGFGDILFLGFLVFFCLWYFFECCFVVFFVMGDRI